MNSVRSASEIDEEAAAWAVRVDAHELDVEHDPELQAWLSGDARRAGALLRAQAAISFLDRGRALANVAPPVDVEAKVAHRPSRRALISGLGGAAAAGWSAVSACGPRDRSGWTRAWGRSVACPWPTVPWWRSTPRPRSKWR
jgi:ferric-dicitrate binding protein FerR (iron transport regulator)